MAVSFHFLVLQPTMVMVMVEVGPSTWYLAGGGGIGGGAPRGEGGEGGGGGGEGGGGEGGGGRGLWAAVTSSGWRSTSAAEVLEVEVLELNSCSRPGARGLRRRLRRYFGWLGAAILASRSTTFSCPGRILQEHLGEAGLEGPAPGFAGSWPCSRRCAGAVRPAPPRPRT